eukprot:2512114-Lingulodinium_polyedra.AAC.1
MAPGRSSGVRLHCFPPPWRGSIGVLAVVHGKAKGLRFHCVQSRIWGGGQQCCPRGGPWQGKRL